VNANTISIKSTRPALIFLLAALAVLSLGFAWRGAGRMLRMRTQAAGNAEFALLKPDDEAKIMIEITEASGEATGDGRIRGKLLEKQDETHYTRTANPAEVTWGKETALVMGKVDDIHAGAVVHVTGKMGADRSLRAKQIVILTGYVQVK
jgi:hypothetical protein